MMVYFIPPEIGCLLGLIFIVYLIGAAMKSTGRKMLNPVDHKNTMTWKEFRKQVGPMT